MFTDHLTVLCFLLCEVAIQIVDVFATPCLFCKANTPTVVEETQRLVTCLKLNGTCQTPTSAGPAKSLDLAILNLEHKNLQEQTKER